MNSIHITTSKKLKGEVPVHVRRVGFLKLFKKYEYDFSESSEMWRVLGKNRDVKPESVSGISGGIIKGGAA